MKIYICVCVCVCVYVCMYEYIYVYICICVHIYIMYVCMLGKTHLLCIYSVYVCVCDLRAHIRWQIRTLRAHGVCSLHVGVYVRIHIFAVQLFVRTYVA
jgi:hypothetical protein